MMSYFVENWDILPLKGLEDDAEQKKDSKLDPLMEFMPICIVFFKKLFQCI